MEQNKQNIRLVKQTYWLIKLRWLAIAGICTATFFARNIMEVPVKDLQLYCVAAALVLENIISLLLLKNFTGNIAIKRILNFKITADLVALTVLLHYSGTL